MGVAVVADLGADGRVERARIALLGAADRPLRVPDAEALLVGQPLDAPDLGPSLGAKVAASIDPSGDHHASTDYRKEVAGTLVERAIALAAERARGVLA